VRSRGNYKISFTEGVSYIITPANVKITPDEDQSKVYGQADKELMFRVETSYTVNSTQYVTYSDEILCWDFYNGGYKFQKPVLFYECINKNEGNTTKLFFSDNTSISIFAHHKLLNAETLEWVTIRSSNVEQFVGQSFIKIDDRNNNTCKAVELTGYEISTQDIIGYSLLIAEYLNCVVDDFFSLEVPLGYEELFIIFDIEENMRYDSDKIEEDIANYGLFTYDDFKDYVSESQFYALCGHYMKIPVAKGLSTPEDMMKLALSYFS